MKKILLILLKTFSVILAIAVTGAIILSLSLQISYVQNLAVSYVTDYLSEKTGAKFSIENIKIGFLNSIEMKGVCILDHQKDTMIFAEDLEANFKGIKPLNGKFRIGTIKLSGADIRVVKEANGKTNIVNVFSKLKNPNRKVEILVNSDKLIINDLRLKYDTIIDIERLNAQIANIDIDRKSYSADIRNITLHEKKRNISLDRFLLSDIKYDTLQTSFSKADIQLGGSRLVADKMQLCYDSPSAIKDGQIETTICEGTEISLETLDLFSKKKKRVSLVIALSGHLMGKVSDFSGELFFNSCGNTAGAEFTVKGLPDINKAYFDVDIKRVKTCHQNITKVLNAFGSKNPPTIISRLGDVTLSGNIKGAIKSFDANARIMTGCGDIALNGKVHPTDTTIELDGDLNILDFNLGRMLANKKTGLLNMQGDMHASHNMSSGMRVNGKFILESLEYGGYTFHDIIIDGKLDKRRFDGTVISENDPNIRFRADGIYDFQKQSLPFFDFHMKLDNFDMAKTGFNKRDSISKISSVITARFAGNDIDNINGFAKIDSAHYINHLDSVDIGKVEISATNSDIEKKIRFQSKFADALFEGKNSYRSLIPFFKEMTKKYIPSFDQVGKIVSSYENEARNENIQTNEQIYDDGYYHFSLTAKSSNKLLSILSPGLEIAKGTCLDFYFSPIRNRFNLSVKSEALSKGKMLIEALNIESHNDQDSLFLRCSTDLLTFGKFNLTGAGVSASLHDNSINLKAFFNDSNNMADIGVKADIGSDHKIHINLLPSKLKIDTSAWDILNKKITVDTGAIVIDSLIITNQKQRIALDGRIGKKMTDTMFFKIDNLDLSPSTFFIKDMGYTFSAVANGHGELISGIKEKILKGHLDVKNMHLLDDYLGNCIITSSYDKDRNRLMLDVTLDDGTMPVTGFYSLSDRILDLNTIFPTFRLKYLFPIFKGTFVDMSGTADSKIHFQLIKGKIPVLNGTAEIKDFATTVNATKARYSLAGHIDLKDNYISTDRGIIHDMDGNTAIMTGYFYSYNFRELKYSIDITSERILGLNLTKKDNDFFFGKVYGNGEFHVHGDERQTFLTADMNTDSGSDFNMPFSSVASIEQNKFITFVDSTSFNKTTEKERDRVRRNFFNKLKRAKYSTEFDMALTIHVTPDVKCNIEYTNSVVSNIVSGRGSGNLYLHYNPRKEIFTMDGGVDIDQGTYRLIFYIADKTFQLKRGGRIWWNGEPSDPLVDFTGIYQVHTSLKPLMSEMSYSGSNVAIDCGIHMTESFFSPTFSFEITAPNATPETQSILRNSLNTQEALSTQFFSLFLTNSFTNVSGNNGMGNMGTSLVSTTGFEFLSNQISSLLSTPNFNWRPTYKPKTEQSSDEFGVQTQVNLMQNKITLNFEGRYYVNPTYSNRQSPFSGGGDISVNLNPSGNLKFKAFTRVIDRFDETQGLQESGVGIYFTQDFDSWADLKNRLNNYWIKKREKREQKKLLREHMEKLKDSTSSISVDTLPSIPDTITNTTTNTTTTIDTAIKPASDSLNTTPKAPKAEKDKMVTFVTSIDN